MRFGVPVRSGVGYLLQVCSRAYNIPFSLEGNRVKVNKPDFVEVKKDKVLDPAWVLVTTEKCEEQICLRKMENNSCAAVFLHGLHMGCEVNPAAGNLHCLCP